VLRDLFEFLEVDPRFAPATQRRHNASRGLIRNPLLRRLWTGTALPRARLRPYLPAALRDTVFRLFTRDLVAAPLDPTLRVELTELFRDDTERLQDLLGRDLSAWLRA
jgi:hypothetical protein